MRFEDRDSLAYETAVLLLQAMKQRQTANGSVGLCLTGGDLANEVYDHMALLAPQSGLVAPDIHLWWNWDYFINIDNPDRNSLQALSRLAGALPFDPAKIHPIPSSSLAADPETGAAQYSQELAEAPMIDICLLELGPQGQIAGLNPPVTDTSYSTLAAAVTGGANGDRQVVTLTPAGLGRCRQTWVLASGVDVADALHSAHDDDPNLPVNHIDDTDSTMWLADAKALSLVPFHRCTL
jgi:6-phosphogluconolactonase